MRFVNSVLAADARRRSARAALPATGWATRRAADTARPGVPVVTTTARRPRRADRALPQRGRHHQRQPARARPRPEPSAARSGAPPRCDRHRLGRRPGRDHHDVGVVRRVRRVPRPRHRAARVAAHPARPRTRARPRRPPRRRVDRAARRRRAARATAGCCRTRVATRRCTGDELLALMAETFGRAKDVVVAVGAVWDRAAAPDHRGAGTRQPGAALRRGRHRAGRARPAGRRADRGPRHRSPVGRPSPTSSRSNTSSPISISRSRRRTS